MTDAAELVKLADWLTHMQVVNKSMEHIPEMAEHCANLRKWEITVRAIASLERVIEDDRFSSECVGVMFRNLWWRLNRPEQGAQP
jgi:hypothetical protein